MTVHFPGELIWEGKGATTPKENKKHQFKNRKLKPLLSTWFNISYTHLSLTI